MSRSRSSRPRTDAPSIDAGGATPAPRHPAPPAGAGPDGRDEHRPGSFFGRHRPGAVLMAGYYIGTLGNALPLPGGIGGVEGGMIGAFLGFGVKGLLATLAVLGYRTISYWLPTGPGAIAYFHLRGRHETPRASEPDPTAGA